MKTTYENVKKKWEERFKKFAHEEADLYGFFYNKKGLKKIYKEKEKNASYRKTWFLKNGNLSKTGLIQVAKKAVDYYRFQIEKEGSYLVDFQKVKKIGYNSKNFPIQKFKIVYRNSSYKYPIIEFLKFKIEDKKSVDKIFTKKEEEALLKICEKEIEEEKKEDERREWMHEIRYFAEKKLGKSLVEDNFNSADDIWRIILKTKKANWVNYWITCRLPGKKIPGSGGYWFKNSLDIKFKKHIKIAKQKIEEITKEETK